MVVLVRERALRTYVVIVFAGVTRRQTSENLVLGYSLCGRNQTF